MASFKQQQMLGQFPQPWVEFFKDLKAFTFKDTWTLAFNDTGPSMLGTPTYELVLRNHDTGEVATHKLGYKDFAQPTPEFLVKLKNFIRATVGPDWTPPPAPPPFVVSDQFARPTPAAPAQVRLAPIVPPRGFRLITLDDE